MEELKILVDNPEQGIANYEPLKAWALEQAKVYGGVIVDPSAITTAKADCAMLRKLAKAASDLRIRIQKEHAAKIANTTAQLTEVAGIFTDAAAKIDSQVKAFDEQRKAARRKEIEAIYAEEIGDLADFIPLDRLSAPSWLNKSTSDKSIRGDIQATVINARQAITQIKALGSKHETEILAAYFERRNMMDALAAKQRLDEMDAAIEKRRAEEERRAAKETEETCAEPPKIEPPVFEPEPPTFEPEPPAIEPEPAETMPVFEKQPETFDFAFVVAGVTQEQIDTLIAFMEGGGYNYAVQL